MGPTPVTVTIRNPAEPHRTWKGLFPVHTGAADSLGILRPCPQGPAGLRIG